MRYLVNFNDLNIKQEVPRCLQLCFSISTYFNDMFVESSRCNRSEQVFFDRVRLGQSAKKRTVKEIITPGGSAAFSLLAQ